MPLLEKAVVYSKISHLKITLDLLYGGNFICPYALDRCYSPSRNPHGHILSVMIKF